jgi:hypothetical protein
VSQPNPLLPVILLFYLLGEPASLLMVRIPIQSCPWSANNYPPFASSPTLSHPTDQVTIFTLKTSTISASSSDTNITRHYIEKKPDIIPVHNQTVFPNTTKHYSWVSNRDNFRISPGDKFKNTVSTRYNFVNFNPRRVLPDQPEISSWRNNQRKVQPC